MTTISESSFEYDIRGTFVVCSPQATGDWCPQFILPPFEAVEYLPSFTCRGIPLDDVTEGRPNHPLLTALASHILACSLVGMAAFVPTTARITASLGDPRSAVSPMVDTAQAFAAPAQRRVRELVYGAGGAFRGWAAQAHAAWPPGGWGGHFGGGHGHGHGDDEWVPDPSWGVAPGVQVIMRGKCDEVYAAAVAQLIQMSNALPPMVRDPSVPVVVLLSWMGAQSKHVSKYKEYYENLGYEVHTLFNGLRTAIVPDAARAQAERLTAFLDAQPEGRPVFIHGISIGTGVYGIFLNQLQENTERLDKFRKQVAGVVFDSGPAPIFPHDVAKGLHTVCPMVSKAIWEGLASALFLVTRAREVFGASEEALRRIQFKTPQLYFYSLDDKVIPDLPKAVQDFMAKNKERGLEVYEQMWSKSVHAAHFKIHHEVYTQKLTEFTQRCMHVFNEKKQIAQ